MTVYVDNMRVRFRGMIMCHMIADTEDELHAMARKIGLNRKWFQQKASGDHYDVALSKRAAAVRYGAVEITLKQCAMMCARQRATGELGSPDDAQRWFATRSTKG